MLHLRIIAYSVVKAASEQPRQKVHREHLEAHFWNPWWQMGHSIMFWTSQSSTQSTLFRTFPYLGTGSFDLKPMPNHYSYYAPKICLNKDANSIRAKQKAWCLCSSIQMNHYQFLPYRSPAEFSSPNRSILITKMAVFGSFACIDTSCQQCTLTGLNQAWQKQNSSTHQDKHSHSLGFN